MKILKNLGIFLLILHFSVMAYAIKPEDNPDVFGTQNRQSDEQKSANQSPETGKKEETKVVYSKPGMEAFSIQGESFFLPEKDIRLGDKFQYIVQVSWKGKLGEIEVQEPDPPLLSNLRLHKIIPSNKTSPETNRALAEFIYLLEGMEKGKAYIGMVHANYTLSDGSGHGSLRIKEQRVDVLAAKHNWGKIIIITGGSIGGIVALSGILFVLFRFLKQRPIAPPPLENEATTPYERIQGELSSMRLFLVEGEIRDFYSKLTKLTKGFVAITEGEGISRMTTDELLHELQKREYDPEVRDRIFAILELCDRVKFAGYIPAKSENEQALKGLENLIRNKMN